MRLESYIDSSDITYEQYVSGIDSYFSVDEGFKEVKDKSVAFVKRQLKMASDEFDKISHELGLSLIQISHALTEKNVFKLLKSIGFSFVKLLSSLNGLSGIVRQGLFDAFEELSKTQLWMKFKSGVAAWDDILDRYPVMKKVTGVLVAGLLFFMWTQMTFIGNLDYDFDFTSIALALKGKYSLEQIFGGPEGAMLLTLFASGSLISVAWLGETVYNLILALVYTGSKKLSTVDHKVVNIIKSKMVFE